MQCVLQCLLSDGLTPYTYLDAELGAYLLGDGYY